MAEHDFSGMLPEEVIVTVEYLAKKKQKLPREPYLDKESGQIVNEVPGEIIDVPGTVARIINAAPGQKLQPVIIIDYPEFTARDLENANHKLAEYDTWIRGSYQRFTNIRLAVAGVNNTVVWPGKVFSFNEVVGPRTVERGYMPAPIIIMGDRGLDYGGGVCQVASTLYNAVLQAGLEVVERHQHSLPVHYVPAGKDAAVDYGKKDFKFKNTSSGPIIIKSEVTRGLVRMQLWGGKA